MGYTCQVFTRVENAIVGWRSYPSCILFGNGGHPKRSQFDYCKHRRFCVFMATRHVGSTTGMLLTIKYSSRMLIYIFDKDYLELLHPAHNKTDEVSVTCLGFPDNETTTFWLGTEEGNVYQAGRYDQAGR